MSEVERLRRMVDSLSTLLEVNIAIAEELKLEKVLLRLTQQAIVVTSGEAGTLWLADEQQSLAPLVIIGGGGRDQLAKMRLAPGEGLAGRVFATGQPLLIADVHSHPRWASRFDNATGFRTRSIICAPLTARGRRLGSLQIINKTGGGYFTDDDLYLLTAMVNMASLTLDSSLQLQQATILSNSLVEVVTAALDARDPFRHGHSPKVAEYSVMLGRFLGIAQDDLDKLSRAALLHDIGKIAVPDGILKKIAGLVGEQASIFARIIAVADHYVHLITDRPSRKAMTREGALAEIERLGGSELDAACAAAFIETVLQSRPSA